MSVTIAGIPNRDVAVTQIGSVTATRDADAARERERPTSADPSGVRPTSIAALAGLALIAIAVTIAVVGLGVSLVRLATGSMTPGYPADSVLVVRSVPAADVAVGDIVTVSRDGLVPITHRVMAVTPVGVSGGAELVLRGDANTADDPEPYQVARVGLVLGGIPFGGSVLVALQSPVGLGVSTVVVCGLLLWAWWPRREPGVHVREPS
jgi:signal peptidase